MKINKVISLLLFSHTVTSISLNQKLSVYAPDVDAEEPAEADADANLLKSAAPKVPVEDLTQVTENEFEEYANNLHDKAGAEKMFTGTDDFQKLQLKQQGPAPAPPTTPNALPKGKFALGEKNMFQAPKSGQKKKKGSNESMYVQENTNAWAKLPKDFEPTLLGGLSMNPAAPDFKNMGTAQYSSLFHDAADSAAKEYDRPYDVLIKESEDRQKKHDLKHDGDEEYNLPDMKDVLVQMRIADDNELMITEDEDDKKHHHKQQAKKEAKQTAISLADAMSYSSTMAEESNAVHGYQTQKKPMSGQGTQEKVSLIEKESEHFEHKKNFYEQILDQEKEKDPNAVHVLAEQERKEERARNPKHKKSTFEDIQDGNAPALSQWASKSSVEGEAPCETCPYDLSMSLVQTDNVLRYFNYI